MGCIRFRNDQITFDHRVDALLHFQFRHGCSRLFLDARNRFEQGLGNMLFAQGLWWSLDFLTGEILMNGTGRSAPTSDGLDHERRSGGGIAPRKKIGQTAQVGLLADCGDEHVDVKNGFGTLHRYGASPTAGVRFPEFHLKVLKPLYAALIIFDDLCRRGQKYEFDAFMLGRDNFDFIGRHLFAGTAI